ncbi:MAG: DUF4419 domain-containing protein [Bacteroidota bacterium]
MKPVYILTLLLCCNLAGNAQKSVVIDVEKLVKPKEVLRIQSYRVILEDLIRSDHDVSRYPLNQKHIDPPFNIVAQSKITDSLVTYGYHPFFEGMLGAYANHRPFTLSPDIMWLLICQGFANHVNNNSESLRSMFVDFKGKTTLVVKDNRIKLDDPESPWEEVFPEFSKQISEFTGKDLTNALTADFSTTTPITKMASQITMLEAMKSYFEFVVIHIGCGIPQVTLEGTPADWQKVLAKTEALRKYKLDWWVDKMEPVLKKIVLASKGKQDKQFWQTMFKWHSQKVYLAPYIVDGWIVKFFPYDKFGRRNNLDSLTTNAALPNEIVKVDVEYQAGDGAGNFVKTPLELWAGFVGLKQNNANFNLRPEIGWMIRKKEEETGKTLKTKLTAANNSAANHGTGPGLRIGEGITIRAKTVPKQLFEIGPINALTIYFTDNIDIPDEVAKLSISRLTLSGVITDEGIQRIRKLFPNTKLTINNKFISE